MLPIWQGFKEVVWSDGEKLFISNLASEEHQEDVVSG